MLLFALVCLIISVIVFVVKERRAKLKLELFATNFVGMDIIRLVDFNLTPQQKDAAIQNDIKIYYWDGDSDSLIPLILNGADSSFVQPTFLESKRFRNYRNNSLPEPKVFNAGNTCFYFYPIRTEGGLKIFAFERKVLKFKEILKRRKKKKR